MDGLGAQARQARRVQPLPARRRARRRSPPSWATSTLLRERALRHHPRRRHGAAARRGAAAGRRAGAPAQPRRVRSRARAASCAGYGILQPRVGVSLPSAHRSRFAAIHSGHPGVDPYTTAVSDVYQDLYGEGSFTGKGIYDVDAFERATHGRFPENTLLSHDLIEGNYARAGLATDIEVFDDYPTRYLTLHPAQAPLDPRRLAAPALAPAAGAGPGRPASATGSRCSRAGRSSTTCAAAGRARAARSSWSPAGRCCPARRCAGPLLGLGAIAAPWIVALLLAVLPSAARQVAGAPTTRRSARDACTSMQQLGARDRLPAAPGVDLGRRDRAHALADAGLRGGTCSSGRRRRRPSAATTGSARVVWRAMWPAVALAAWPWSPCVRAARRCRRGAWRWPTSRSARAAARRALAGVARRSRRRSARRPCGASAGSPRRRAGGRRCATRCCTGASSSASSARRPTGSRPTTSRRSRAGRGDADVADQHRAPAPRHGQRVRPRLHHARRHGSSGSSWRSARSSGCGASAATSTTGTTSSDLRVLEPAYVSHGGQRQPGRAPHRAPAGLPRAGRAARSWTRGSGARSTRRRSCSRDERLLTLPARQSAALEQLRAARAALALAGEPVTAAALGADQRDALASAEAALAAGADSAPEVLAPARRVDHLEPAPGGRASASCSADSTRRRPSRCAGSPPPGPTPRASSPGSRPWPTARPTFAMEMDFGFLFDGEREAVRHRLPVRPPTRSTRRTTTCSPPRRGWRASWRSPRTTCRWTTGSGSAARSPTPRGETALVSWSGSMFEYLMPTLVMRSFPEHVLDADLHGRGAAADRVRRRARRALGRERERVQRARPPPHLSVPRLRRARPGAQARPGPRPGGRAVRLGARGDGRRRSARSPTSRALEKHGRAGRLRLPRRARLHPPRSRRDASRVVRDLHGAPRRA